MAVTTGMLGHGFYDRNSAPQWAAIEAVLPWLEEAIEAGGLGVATSAITLADFGCSEGRNSASVMQRLISVLRRRTADPIQTIHSDLPTNDFSSLLSELRREGRSAFGENVFSSIVGGSMFDNLLAPRSTHIAMTFNAIGFLSQKPLDGLPGYILPNGPSTLRAKGWVTPEEHAAFAARALSDIETFYRARAAELVPGGKLLVEVFGVGAAGRTCDGIYDALNDAVLEVLEEGLIDQAGYNAYYQPVYFRSLDELTLPVAGPAAPLRTLFRVERAETYEVAVPFVENFRRNGDTSAFAKSYTDFFRAFCEPVLRMAFPSSPELADDVFGRAERLIREHPERYEFHYVSVAALLTRL